MNVIKSLYIIIFAFFSVTFCIAQDSLKFTKKMLTTELNVNLLQGQLNLNNAINQIKFRYKYTEQIALRIAFSFNTYKNEFSQHTSYGINPIDNINTKKRTTLSLNLGAERHLAGTKRLSPYFGAEIAFGLKRSSNIIENTTSKTTVDGAWQNIEYSASGYQSNLSMSYEEPGYTSIGLNFIAGFDFYLAKHIYCGYELMYSFRYQKNAPISTDYVPKDGSTSVTTYPDVKGSQFEMGPQLINGIRIGFVF